MDIFAMVERGGGGGGGGQKPISLIFIFACLVRKKKYFVVEGGQPKKKGLGRSTSCILNFRKRGLNFVFFKNRIILCLGVYYFN